MSIIIKNNNQSMRYRLLELFRRIVLLNIPGKYILSRYYTKIIYPHYGIVDGYIGNYRVELDLEDWIQQQIYYGIYENDESKLIKNILKPGDIFFDLGANVGYYSFIASQLVGNTGMVHSFEPIINNVTTLKRNIEANTITNIVVNPLAIGSKSGLLILYTEHGCPNNSGTASKIKVLNKRTQINVQVISLDEYIKIHKIDCIRLIKIDIEGSELDALLGGQYLLSQGNAPDIVCEVNPFFFDLLNQDSRVLTHYLADIGYLLYQVKDLSLVKPDVKISRITNLFCTKNANQIEGMQIR
jgi:FkbM family methyltransferase